MVYVEYVLFDNFVIDVLLLAIARKSYRLDAKFRRLVYPALLGAIVALAMPIITQNQGWLFTVRVLLGFLMVALSGKFKNIKEYFFCYYLFIFYTFLFGGGVCAALYFVGIKYDPLVGVSDVNFPLGFVLSVCCTLYFLLAKILKGLYKRRDIERFVLDCAVSIGGETFEVKGFVDSGNRLVFKKTGSPVVLCSPSFARKTLFNRDVNAFSLGDMPIETVAGKSAIKILKLDKLVIYRGDFPNIINNVVIGLSEREFDSDGDYDLILSPILV